MNKTLLKAIITSIMVFALLIPTSFIQSLIREREAREREVFTEVSNKWSGPQTITTPYLLIPYLMVEKNASGKDISIEKQLIFFPDNLLVNTNLIPEFRPRSIYKVLLYRSFSSVKGDFNLKLPDGITASMLLLKKASFCLGIDDFKGIEKKISVQLNNNSLELSPGLPDSILNDNGLSTPIDLNENNLFSRINFSTNISLKGSEHLRFTPFAGNSKFEMNSTWTSPAFDGNNLPDERILNNNGFKAKWVYNKTNLPFGTVLNNKKINSKSLSFGVNMVNPTNHYAKTMRCAKYAILFIGLTFALFFIIEIMQEKPMHPVQFGLIGFALVIFFTLLLSIGEFIFFDYAYCVSASATILLISLYAQSHFKKWSTAGLFALIIAIQYVFIFVLIRLEDTALLLGSIGLFVILALIMFATRKLNWYDNSLK
ncbi:MAG: cell envelope integrity protein CreD [Bacteroidota bacterium]|jgi:inner membrane protein